jgi:hemerythrin-like metal-binding protein
MTAVGKLEWDDSLSFNHLIDHQHKHLIVRTNYLYDCLVLEDSDCEMKVLLEKVLQEAHLHFATEEKMFDDLKFSQAKEHKREHRSLEKLLLKLLNEFDSASRIVKVSIVLDFKLHLIKHLIEKDVVFIKELKTRV